MISKSKIFFVDMIFKGTLRAREITLDSECRKDVKGIHKVHYHQNLYFQNGHTTLTDTAYFIEMIMHLIPSFKKRK